jgi:hypothetical protein
MAALSRRERFMPLACRRLTGSAFILGFILLGVAISHWHFG